MTADTTVDETGETQEELKQGEVNPQSQAPDVPPQQLPPMKSGYVIGISEDDQFVFEILGSEPSIVDLLGLHTLAGDRITTRVDFQLGGTSATTLAKLDSILSILTGAPAAPGGNKLT